MRALPGSRRNGWRCAARGAARKSGCHGANNAQLYRAAAMAVERLGLHLNEAQGQARSVPVGAAAVAGIIPPAEVPHDCTNVASDGFHVDVVKRHLPPRCRPINPVAAATSPTAGTNGGACRDCHKVRNRADVHTGARSCQPRQQSARSGRRSMGRPSPGRSRHRYRARHRGFLPWRS